MTGNTSGVVLKVGDGNSRMLHRNRHESGIAAPSQLKGAGSNKRGRKGEDAVVMVAAADVGKRKGRTSNAPPKATAAEPVAKRPRGDAPTNDEAAAQAAATDKCL